MAGVYWGGGLLNYAPPSLIREKGEKEKNKLRIIMKGKARKHNFSFIWKIILLILYAPPPKISFFAPVAEYCLHLLTHQGGHKNI